MKRGEFYSTGALLLLLAVAVAAVLPRSAGATMYRCVSASGGVLYTNISSHRQCTPLSLPRTQKTQSRWKGGTLAKNSHSYDSFIRASAIRYGVDAALIKAIIHIESGFNHQAVSHRGAKGLMQLMPETSRELRVYNPFDPHQNVDAGTRYFRQIMDELGGDIALSLAAYNAGPNLVKRLGHIPAIPETKEYVRKVLKMYRIYKNKW